MNIQCKICGKTVENLDICPLCGSKLSDQNEIDDNYITKGLNEKFQDKKIDIKFNLRQIVNELDYKKDFENDAIELVDEKYQYLQSDITEKNYEKIKENIKFYINDLNNFKKNEKHKLEIAGTEDLQEIISKFNDVINICTKYKKFVPDNKIKSDLDNVIREYDKEVNYIKKYFVLPLYEADKILAASRLAKNLLNLISIFFIYFVLSRLPFVQHIYDMIGTFFANVGNLSPNLFLSNIKAFASYMIGLGLTEVLFAYYISFTIKNRNFKVDKNRNLEPIYYFVPVLFFLSLYANIFAYFYNLLFITYIVKVIISSLRQKRFLPNWIIVKIATTIIGLVTVMDVILTLF